MAGDFDTSTGPKIGDPADKVVVAPALAHRSGYGTATVEEVLARVKRREGHGLTPAEVRTLAMEVEGLRGELMRVATEAGMPEGWECSAQLVRAKMHTLDMALAELDRLRARELAVLQLIEDAIDLSDGYRNTPAMDRTITALKCWRHGDQP